MAVGEFGSEVGLWETSEVYEWFWRDVPERSVRDRLGRLTRRSVAMSDGQPSDAAYGGTSVTYADDAEWPSLSVAPPAADDRGGEDVDELTRSEDLHWQISYDRASVDRFVAEVEAERARLQAAIEEARARLRQARAEATARQAEAREELGALVLAAQQELEEIERHHRETLEVIQAAAVEEAARLLIRAREEVAAVRATAASLAARVNIQGTGSAPSVDVDALVARLADNRSDDR